MSNSYYYNGNIYEPSTYGDRNQGFLLASAASGAIMSGLPYCCKPFEKQLSEEVKNNFKYKQPFLDSLKISGLDKKGVEIIEAQHSSVADVYSLGTNAAYFPKAKKVKINTDKISIAGFHELGHAMNDITGKTGKLLSKMRWPGRIIAGLMGYVALFSRSKPKDAPKDMSDHIKDNCGEIAFISMLPTVFEEGMASYKGIQLAKKTNLAKPLIDNMKKIYGKALLTYIGHATLTGLAVGAASMIMDHYSRPQKVASTNDYFLF